MDASTADIRRLVGIPSLFGFSGENERAITLMQACKKALEFSGENYIGSILYVKRGYVIMPAPEEWTAANKTPCIVYIASGKAEAYSAADHMEEINAGKFLKVPYQYAFPKSNVPF